ncbi:MAG: TylF/MycF family methyltransferase [Candidatus Obscuribacterales bacterium]|nr:TylF/MycF family methyltransferase [Candidatus Obscuribacterales bacterium]
MDAKDLYLDLLAKSLTNTFFADEPDPDQESQAQYVKGFIEHYISGTAITMLPMARMRNLRHCVVDTIKNNVPGDLIETGVWRGGATIYMRAILKAYNITDKTVWVADSFEGLPEPDSELNPIEYKAFKGPVMTKVYKHFAVGLDEVKRNFAAYDLLDEQVQFLKGWFKDTLPDAPIKSLSVLRLDGDFYESTIDSLNNLYPKLSRGGYLIIDDYGEESWTECKRAVEEYRAKHGIKDELIRVDSNCYYCQRS